MVNFIHYFGYLEFNYMEFPLIWNILAGTNAFLVSEIGCIVQLFQPLVSKVGSSSSYSSKGHAHFSASELFDCGLH